MSKRATPRAPRKDAAAELTYDEAQRIAGGVAAEFEDRSRDLARLVLLLRWLAYHASDRDRESLYIQIEGAAMPFIGGTEEVVEKQMRAELDALRKGGRVMLDYLCSLAEQHRAQLRDPHTPRREGKPLRFPRLLVRFSRREPRRKKRGDKA